MLSCGALGSMPFGVAQAFWFGSKTEQLDDDKSIFTLKGDVQVNNERANKDTRIRAGDKCEPATTARSCSRLAEIHS